MNRRLFVKSIGLGATSLLAHKTSAFAQKRSKFKNEIYFGIVSDVHADVHPNCKQRLRQFIHEAEHRQVDFIIQLGDFCRPKDNENPVFEVWDNSPLRKFHVLGNHDMDYHKKEEVMKHWNMPAPYYSYDVHDFHLVVLDANYLYQNGQYIDYANANYYVDDAERAFINPQQHEWLRNDLAKTDKRTLIFSHQSLINNCWGVKNRIEVQQILERANGESGFQKVLACFNGHDHIDFYRDINNIHYFEINSMDYQWLDDKYKDSSRFSKEHYEQKGFLANIAPYRDPLYAFVKISEKQLSLEGVQSEWHGLSPEQLGMPEQVVGCRYSPVISNRDVLFDKK